MVVVNYFGHELIILDNCSTDFGYREQWYFH